MDQIRGQIAERKLKLGSDEFIETLLNDQKQEIETTTAQLEKDRTESEKMVLAAEAAFRKAVPQVADLPKGQEGLAGKLTDKVDTLQTARKAYTDAVKARTNRPTSSSSSFRRKRRPCRGRLRPASEIWVRRSRS